MSSQPLIRQRTITVNCTDWLAVFALFIAGCTLAVHVGKLPAALPLLVSEFELSLAHSGYIVSIYSALIALSGLMLGLLVSRMGHMRFAITGVAIAGIGSVMGAVSPSFWTLLIGRAIEGFGWILAVIAIPALLNLLSTERDRPVVMGLWGAFMPVGAGLMLLAAPFVQSIGGWRLLWWVAATLSMVGVGLILLVYRRHHDVLRSQSVLLGKQVASDLKKRSAHALFLCFFFYSFQFVTLTSFLPTMLVSDSAYSLRTASMLGALVILANAIGNIAAGRLLRRGIEHWVILAVAGSVIGVMSLLVFTITEPGIRLGAALLFTSVGGLIPGTLFSTAPIIASTAAAVGVLIGFMLQAAGLGQVLGPLAITTLIERTGAWPAGGVLMLCAGLCGSAAAFWLRKLPGPA